MKTDRALRPPLRLTELFPPQAIRVGLNHHSKSAVIEELVRHAVVLGYLGRQEERLLIDTILAREDLGSTALGNGLAFPHCQWRTLDRFVGVAGLLHHGIPFDAVDGEPVDWIFLTLAPPSIPEQSFDVLGRLAAIGHNQGLRLLLSDCRTVEQIYAFLDGIDRPVVGQLDDLARMSLTLLDPVPGDPWREMARFGLLREERPARDSRGFFESRWL